MNVAYLIWLENLSSPILRGQVIEVMKIIGKISSQDNFYFLAFQPIQAFLLRNQDFHNIRRELKENNIHLVLIPSFLVLKNKWFSAKWVPLIFLQSFTVLLFLAFVYRIDILHCRSYPITLSAITVKKLIKKLKIIFDPRSPFPEENITIMWKYNSLSYQLWKYLEKEYLKESDITIAISNTYVEHFKRIYADTKFEVIPNNADVTKFTMDNEFRKYFRKYLGIDETELLFVYSGSLGNPWNDPEVYAKFIIKLRELDIKHNFLFLTNNVNNLKKVFDEYSIKSNEYFVFPIHFNEMPKYLSAADFGLNLMERKDIRISIKTVEYLAMGLPIVITSNVIGANEIVEQHCIGFVIEDIESINMDKLKNFIYQKKRISLRCRNLASEKFSTEYIAKEYIRVYNNMDCIGRSVPGRYK